MNTEKDSDLKDSGFVIASKNVNDLVSNHFLNSLTSRFQVLARIEVIRMLSKVLADVTCHSKTDIGVDVDLADSKLSSLSQLLFRNTYCIRHISAVLVNHLYELLRYRRRSVKNDREARQSLNALFKNVETKWWRNKDAVCISCTLISSELVSAVACSDCDSKGIAACSAYELLNLFRTCIALMTRLNNNLILDTSQSTKLSLYYYAMSMCVLNNLLCQSDVVLESSWKKRRS